MAKTTVSEWDSVATNNLDIDGINISNDCPPSYVNDAIREMMAQLKDWQMGTPAQPLTSNGTFTSNGATEINGSFSLSGNLGTSGQVLTSTGSVATPTWTSLGTMSVQNKDTVEITGGTIAGATVNGNVVGSNGTGNKTFSTGNPSGGQNGDIWYKYI